MQIKEIFKSAILLLKQNHIDTPELDARILLEYAANITKETIFFNNELEISPEIIAAYKNLIEQRIKNEPVAKIIGKKSFWKSDFFVNCHTLDPRPDSEIIIETSLKLLSHKNDTLNFLDLGTGSGCLILSLLQEFPNAKGIAVDISKEALEVAKKNAIALGLENRITLLQGNWADEIKDKFDLIVTNPPYIPRADILNLAAEVREYDPLLALDGGDDGLDPYRYLAKQLKEILKANACAILEFGYDQGDKVKEILINNNYSVKEMLFDLSGNQRAIRVSI